MASIPSHAFLLAQSEMVEEPEVCNTLTVIDYGNINRENHWMTPQYLNLRLRCSRLMVDETRQALRHHFRRANPQKLQKLLQFQSETKLQAEREECLTKRSQGNVADYLDPHRHSRICTDGSSLPTFLAVPINDREAATGFLEESFMVN
eukprot:Gb_21236 [translate_table: standard]